MTPSNTMMKNTCVTVTVTVVLKYQSCNLIQTKDIEISMPKVTKQWKLQSNGHLTYPQNGSLFSFLPVCIIAQKLKCKLSLGGP